MSKKFLIALMFSGSAYAAAPEISVRASLPASRPLCPFLDEKIAVTYTDDENEGKKAVLTISCQAKGAQQKTTRFTSQPVTLVKAPERQPPPDDKKPNSYDEFDVVPHVRACRHFDDVWLCSPIKSDILPACV